MSTVDDNWGRVSDTFVTEANHDLKYPCVTAVLAFYIFGDYSVKFEFLSII
jgi:hypothetical protein